MQIHPVDYQTEIFNFLIGSEGFAMGRPYFDTANPPKATIGYGVNIEITDYLLIVLQRVGVFAGKTNAEIATIRQEFTNEINLTPKDDPIALQSNLDILAQQYGLDYFTMAPDQARGAFNDILSGVTIGGTVIEGKEQRLDSKINGVRLD